MRLLYRLGMVLGLVFLALTTHPEMAAAQGVERRALPALPDLPVADGKRVALVIGNSNYVEERSWRAIPNATRDAQYVTQQLQNPVNGAGAFEVLMLVDANYEQMKAGIERFTAMAASADIALVYYAGHGFEFNLENFLVPIDAPPAVSPRSVERSHIKMADVIKASTARQFSLFFLDACRTTDALRNTGQNSAGNRATLFGAIDARGSGVIYSASRGESAYDAAPAGESNSPFAKAVVRYLEYPGLSLYDFFSYVSLKVEKDTAGLRPPQSPTIGGRGGHQFFIVPKVQAAAVDTPAPPRSDTPTTISLADIVGELMGEDDDKFILLEALDAYGIAQLQTLSDQNDALASIILGHIYFQGLTVDVDLAKADSLFERSAQDGNPEGLYALGRFLEILTIDNGLDWPTQYDVGNLYRGAYAQNSLKAALRLADLYAAEQIALPDDDPNEHIKIWQALAELNYPSAHLELAIRDIDAAFHMDALMTMAGQGNTDAAAQLCMVDFADGPATRTEYCLAAADEGDELAIFVLTAELLPQANHSLDASEVAYWARIGLNFPYLPDETKPCLEGLAEGTASLEACRTAAAIFD